MLATRKRLRARRRPVPIRKDVGQLLPVILACISLLGILLGSVWEACARYSQNEYANYFVLQYLERYDYVSFAPLFKALIWPALLPLLFLIYNSFSCIGSPFIFFVPLLKGFSIGSISGYLYSTHGLHGMAAVLILFFLPQILQLWAIIFLSENAANASFGLLLTHFSGQILDEKFRLGCALRAFGQSMLLTVVSCLIESALSIVFAPILL